MDQQHHYLLTHDPLPSALRLCAPLTVNGHPLLCLASTNRLQLFEYSGGGLRLQRSVPLRCQLSALEVLEDRHRGTDWIFLVDARGRHCFWDPLAGFTFSNNQPQPQWQQQQVFAGGHSHPLRCCLAHGFEVLDSRACLLLLTRDSALRIDVTVKAGGLRREPGRVLDLSLVRWRQAALVGDPCRPLLALVQLQEERSFLLLFDLDGPLSAQSALWRLEVPGLAEVRGLSAEQVLLRTDDQLLVVCLENREVVARHGVRAPLSRLLVVSPTLYGCLGEELLLVRDKQLRRCGSLVVAGEQLLKDRPLLQVAFLRETEGGTFLLAALSDSQALFISVGPRSWQLYHRESRLGPVFAVERAGQDSRLAVVSCPRPDCFTLWQLRPRSLVPVSQQQAISQSTQRLVALQGGEFLVAGGADSSLLLRRAGGSYQQWPLEGLPPGEVLAASDSFLVTDQAVLCWDLPRGSSQLLLTAEVLLASVRGRSLVFLDSSRQVYLVRLTAEGLERSCVRTASASEYLWHLCPDDSLLVAESDSPLALKRYRGAVSSAVCLPQGGVVSAMAQDEKGNLFLGYADGHFALVRLGLVGQNTTHLARTLGPALAFCAWTRPGQLLAATSHQLLLIDLPSQHYQELALLDQQETLSAAAVAYDSQELLCSLRRGSEWLLRRTRLPLPSDRLELCPRQIFEFGEEAPLVLFRGRRLFAAVRGRLLVFEEGTLVLQFQNFLVDVVGLEQWEGGVAVCGVDQLSRNLVLLWGEEQQAVVASVNLILRDHRYIKAVRFLRGGGSPRFLCRGEKHLTLFELSQHWEPQELAEIKADFQGYCLQVGPPGAMLSEQGAETDREGEGKGRAEQLCALTDSFRFLAVYHFETNRIVPVSRWLAPSEINEALLLPGAALLALQQGQLILLEHNFGQQPALRMQPTIVASFSLGAQPTALARSGETCLFGTAEGTTGRVSLLTEEQFEVLRKAEKRVLAEQAQGFDYGGWRQRLPRDKLIDAELIEEYLACFAEDPSQQALYVQVQKAFSRLS